MALITIEGVYENGIVTLAETPGRTGKARVMVTFLTDDPERELSAGRDGARRRAFARMRAGISLGGPAYPAREELHDRRGSN